MGAKNLSVGGGGEGTRDSSSCFPASLEVLKLRETSAWVLKDDVMVHAR